MTRDELKQLFANHDESEEQVKVMLEVRSMAWKLAGTMLVNSPNCPEQTIAIRKIWEGLAYFNHAITSAPVREAKSETQGIHQKPEQLD